MLVFDPKNGCAGDMIIAALTDLGVEGVCDAARDILEVSGAEGGVSVEGHKDGTRLNLHIDRDVEDFEVAYARCLAMEFPARAKDFARRTIDQMIAFEREIHGKHFHLHELKSADTLVDVFTSAYCLDRYDFEAASLPIATGSGLVRTSHGMMENPPPLGRRFLETRKFPSFRKEIEFEISTPTGIAILTSLNPVDKIEGKIIRTGRGYGTTEIPGYENCLIVHEVEKE